MTQALIAGAYQEEEYSRLTREAMVGVDYGKVIDHLIVIAWADSLNTDSPRPAHLFKI